MTRLMFTVMAARSENDTYVADDAVYKVNNSFYHKPLFLTQSKNYPK